MSSALVWLHNDLRLDDTQALALATRQSDTVYVAVCLEKEFFTSDHASAKRSTFLLHALQSLDGALAKHSSRLLIVEGDPVLTIPSLAKELAVTHVVWTREYTPKSKTTDLQIRETLKAAGINAFIVSDLLVADPEEIMSPDGSPYTRFIPFWKHWWKLVRTKHISVPPIELNHLASPPGPLLQKGEIILTSYRHTYATEKLTSLSFEPSYEALKRRQKLFFGTLIHDYHARKDQLGSGGSSHMSAYIRFGMVSIRSLLWEAFHSDTNRFPETRDLSKGQLAFIRQLCWREFFTHIAFHFPHSMTKPFDSKWNTLKWENDEALFTSWKEATTGFPLIDAGMRELNATGYMHNVARMMTAGFLTKYLLVDWRKGEQYFAQKLIDYDPALSVGNWQLAAGTGASAQPHFLIFKPDYQPNTDLHGYVEHWVPEYRSSSYPTPIIDTKQRRLQALAMYEKALK